MSDNTATALIFVMTEEDFNNGEDEQGVWLDVQEYNSADDLMTAAREWSEANGSEYKGKPAELRYAGTDISFMQEGDNDCHFDRDAIVSETNVSQDLWDIMALSDDDRNMLNAWLCLSWDTTGSISEHLEKARTNFIGHFESYEKFGKELLFRSGFFEDAPQELLEAVNLEKVADVLGVNCNNFEGYYFER